MTINGLIGIRSSTGLPVGNKRMEFLTHDELESMLKQEFEFEGLDWMGTERTVKTVNFNHLKFQGG